jgi:hypothetical protein
MDSFDRDFSAIALASVELGNERRRVDRSLRLYKFHEFQQKATLDSLSGTNRKLLGFVLLGRSLLRSVSLALIVSFIVGRTLFGIYRAFFLHHLLLRVH